MLKRLVLLSLLLLLFGIAFGARASTAPALRTETESGATLSDGDGSGGTPTDPARAMEEAVNIYIRVILRQPDGPPPPSPIEILEAVNTTSDHHITIKAPALPSEYGGDRYNVYRQKTWPMFYAADLSGTTNLVGHTAILWFYDFFTDPYAGGLYGVGDTAVNYYYVMTTIDSNTTTHALTESPYPSNCVCEFDQLCKKSTLGFRNVLTYPCDHRYRTARAIGAVITGATAISKWSVTSQVWSSIATRTGTGTWIKPPTANDSLYPGDVFAVNFSLTGIDNTMFSTNLPGSIAEDKSIMFRKYTWLPYAWNWIMVPMKFTYLIKPTYAPTGNLYVRHLAEEIGSDITYEIRTWNRNTQTMVTAARYVTATHVWTGTTICRPGMAIAVGVRADATEPWPPTS